MFCNLLRFAAVALALATVAPHSVQAACSFGKCNNAVWAPGAQRTPSGGISGGAHLTPYGVTSGHQTSYGVSAGNQTSYGVSSGHQTAFGVSGGHQTSYGVSGGHQTAYGVTSGQQTSYGVMGAGCRRTAFGVVCSDIRLKRDLVALGRLDNGLALYRFRYLWSDQVYVGVMAQDVQSMMPEAVVRGRDGYLRVNYDRLGAPFMTWDQWQALNQRVTMSQIR
jgi:Chaperone of endosialidase